MTYFGTRLSENMSRREPEGYLICLNVPVARTGTQEYLPEELGQPHGGPPIPVYRPEDEVFSPATEASFEGMPVTDDHPSFPEGVTAENIRYLQKGHAHNIRRGTGEEADLLLADLIITDPDLIDEILSGKREISCGYNYRLCEESGRYIQRDIRGNHIAVVDAGRAGPRVSIRDRAARTNPAPNPKSTESVNHTHPDERSTTHMKQTQGNPAARDTGAPRRTRSQMYAKRTARLMAHMAKDGETEELAEMIAELMEPEVIETPAADPVEEVAEIAEAVAEVIAEEAPADPEPVAIVAPENREITIDSMEQIVSLLQQIIALLQPAADCGSGCKPSDDCGKPTADEDPAPESETAEAIAEAVLEAMENPAADPVEAMVEEVVEEALQENPEEAAEGIAEAIETVIEDPDPGDEDPYSDLIEPENGIADRARDALKTVLPDFRSAMKAMSASDRNRMIRRIVTGINARERKQAASGSAADGATPVSIPITGATPDAYALLRNAASSRRAASGPELGQRIMARRNANLRGNA